MSQTMDPLRDFERNTWADWCGSAFATAFGAFSAGSRRYAAGGYVQ